MFMRASSLIQILRTGGSRGSSSGNSRAMDCCDRPLCGQTETVAYFGAGERCDGYAFLRGESVLIASMSCRIRLPRREPAPL